MACGAFSDYKRRHTRQRTGNGGGQRKKREPADPLPHREENTGEKMNMTGRTISATGSGKSKRIMKRSFSRFLIAAGGFFTVVFAIGGLNNLFFRCLRIRFSPFATVIYRLSLQAFLHLS